MIWGVRARPPSLNGDAPTLDSECARHKAYRYPKLLPKSFADLYTIDWRARMAVGRSV